MEHHAQTKKSHRGGFTLVELLVSVAIFSIVMMIAVGALLTMAEANRKAQAIKSVMNNLNFAIESLSRTIRVGTTYHCGVSGAVNVAQNCTGGSQYFAFESASGDPNTNADQYVYRFANNRLERSTNGGGTFVAVTAPEVVIEDLRFYVVGAIPGDTVAPKVVIVVRGYAGISSRTRSNFNLQTTVTQRLLDI